MRHMCCTFLFFFILMNVAEERPNTAHAARLCASTTQQPLSITLSLLTCEGALQESPPLISPIRAAAVGLLELMRTGPLISMEWR